MSMKRQWVGYVSMRFRIREWNSFLNDPLPAYATLLLMILNTLSDEVPPGYVAVVFSYREVEGILESLKTGKFVVDEEGGREEEAEKYDEMWRVLSRELNHYGNTMERLSRIFPVMHLNYKMMQLFISAEIISADYYATHTSSSYMYYHTTLLEKLLGIQLAAMVAEADVSPEE